MKALTVVVVALTVAGLAAAEKQLQITDLPAAVQKAVRQEEAKGATVKSIVAEKEGAKTLYEVETLANGRTRDVIFDTTGRVIEAEDEVAIDAVPPAAKAALEASGKVIKVEALTRGTRVIYEGQIEKNGKKSEVMVDATGTHVKR